MSRPIAAVFGCVWQSSLILRYVSRLSQFCSVCENLLANAQRRAFPRLAYEDKGRTIGAEALVDVKRNVFVIADTGATNQREPLLQRTGHEICLAYRRHHRLRILSEKR
jgi:hypothetical protein